METNPYQPPSSEISKNTESIRPLEKTHFKLAILACCLYIAPLLGQLASSVYLEFTLRILNYDNTPINVDNISTRLYEIMYFFIATLFLGFIGIIFMLLTIKKSPPAWFYCSGMLISALWAVVIFPLGLIVGVPMFITFLIKRKNNQLS